MKVSTSTSPQLDSFKRYQYTYHVTSTQFIPTVRELETHHKLQQQEGFLAKEITKLEGRYLSNDSALSIIALSAQ